MSEQTQDSIDWIRQQCDRFLDESPTYAAFVRDIFQMVAESHGVDAVALVAFSKSKEPRIVAESNLSAVSQDEFFNIDLDHVSLLHEVLREGKPQFVVDRSLPETGLRRHSITMAPILIPNHPAHILELFSLEVPNHEEAAHLRELAETMVGYFTQFLVDKNVVQEPTTDDNFWQRFDSYVLRLQKSLDLKQTISVAVNDGRVLIGADRVSIALRYGNQTRVRGVSGQDGVQHRANLVQSMSRLAAEALKIGETVTYRGTIEDLPPTLEAPLAEYLAESRTRMVMLIPLREIAPEKDEDLDEADQNLTRRLIGCLIVEQATEARPKKSVVERTELVREHIETAIDNCHKHETIFLLPLWRGIGKTLRWFKGRRFWIAIAVIIGLFAIGTALAVVPWDYRVEGSGQAMPVIQHRVYAPWDGDVVEVFVNSGDEVVAGQKLLRIESDDLHAELVAAQTEVREKEKLVLALKKQSSDANRQNDRVAKINVLTEQAQAEVELEGGKERLKTIEDRIKKLTVKAPEAGVVATFQVDQVLRNRPVRRGDLLVEVMQPDGPWHLELEIPEYRMGHVMRAFRDKNTSELPVEYLLATAVETTYDGTLHKEDIATRSNESEETGTIFQVDVDINKDDLPNRNIGSDVSVKINCGKKSLFYVLFGDVVEFVQRYVWL